MRVEVRSRAWVLGAVLSAAALLQSSESRAHGAGGRELPRDAPAVTAEGTEAKAELDGLAATEETRRVAAERIEQGRRALARAHGAHAAGDADGARALSLVARAWARSARSAVEAAAVEARATEAQAKAQELTEKLARARSLLAETQARRGQLRAEIARAEEAAKAARERTVEVERGRSGARGASEAGPGARGGADR